jgi:hypothetical protein
MTGFRWRDSPVWIFSFFISVALLNGLNFAADRSLSFLDRDTNLFVCGALMGFGAGLWVARFLTTVGSATVLKSDSSKSMPLSDTVK